MAVVFTSALVLGLAAAPLVWQRFSESFATGGSGRTSIWHTGLLAMADNWLKGDGLSNFAIAYNARYLQVFQRYQAGWSRAPHDIVISTVVELGIIGLVLLGVAFAAQFHLLARIGPDDELYDYRLMVTGSFIGLLIVAFFIDLMTYKYLWFTMAAMTQVYAAWAQRNTSEPVHAERSLQLSISPSS
ncbi:MAG TPA: O-antigen ligase family protein [Candidatus Cybelea sp.]